METKFIHLFNTNNDSINDFFLDFPQSDMIIIKTEIALCNYLLDTTAQH